MSLSLIGIIFVQSYFINKSLQDEREQFKLSVKRSLSFTSNEIEEIEFANFIEKLQQYKVDKEPDSTLLRKIFVTLDDEANDQTIVHSNIVVEERFRSPSLFFEIDADSIDLSSFSNQRVTEVYNNSSLYEGLRSPIKKTNEVTELPEETKRLMQKNSFKDLIKAYDYPIYKRINQEKLEDLLRKNLSNQGIDIDFEYAIYDEDLSTKIKSDNFEITKSSRGIEILLDDNNESPYRLWIDFPGRNKFLVSSILLMIVLSIVFTSIIVIAYSSAIYQLIKQRQISQIKTDFINNMTHEFKTPIATINLALDAIKNPKIIGDAEKVKRYLGMIKDENKRMHAQVENVLRISKLEKNELNISKERIKLHDLVEDAITHVELIVEDRKGYVKLHLNAVKSSILANETHFTNVVVNILDNAIKYSDNTPEIDVYTENVGNNILLKIADKGNGMSKQVQKKVFEKFYREHSGNVHNVKGHGLGLAYVKRIIDDHQGHISVESEKGKGSTFIVSLPLIS
ncbi:sensor histidine kinase [Winogradskyella immobilis]|nr:HAMP domain-containing sensor histidine kinase [Winogradskyella immobilis]MCG0016901.1 HAMP domain-containing histidine kinase [Winogradskyella immobilis]